MAIKKTFPKFVTMYIREMNEPTNERTNEPTNEPMNEWMNEGAQEQSQPTFVNPRI